MLTTEPAPFPAKLAAWLNQDDKPTPTSSETPLRIPQGERNTTLASLAGTIRRRGATLPELEALLQATNHHRCDPPLDPRDVTRIAQSIHRYPPAQAPTNGTGTDPETNPDDTYQLLTNHQIDQLKDPEWLAQGAIPKHAFTVTYGPSGAYKTFDVTDLALATSLGLHWHNRPTQQGHVIYVLAEGIGGFKQRRHAWMRHRNVDSTPNFHLLPTPVPFTDPHCLDKLIRTAQTLEEPPILIIVDTLARSMPGGDENATKDMSELVAAVDHIRHQVGCGIHLVHHTGHDTSRERGNTALRAAADTMIRTTKTPEGLIRVKCDKQKDADEFGPDWLRFEPILMTDSGVLVPAEPPASHDDTLRRARAEDIAAWIIAQPHHRAWPRQIKEAFGIGDEALRERRHALRQQGIAYIQADRRSRYVAAAPTYQGGLLEEDLRALETTQ